MMIMMVFHDGDADQDAGGLSTQVNLAGNFQGLICQHLTCNKWMTIIKT